MSSILELRKTVEEITSIIVDYENGIFFTEEKLILNRRKLSCLIYRLTKINIDTYSLWNECIYNFEGSNASAKVHADKKYPELRMTRKIIESAENVCISMSSEIKYLDK